MKRSIYLLAFMVIVTLMTAAQSDYPKVELSGDYSYLYVNPQKITTQNFNGGGGSFVFNLNSFFGLKADFQGYGGGTGWTNYLRDHGYPITGSASGNLFTYMFGPQIKKHTGKFQPFGEALFGAYHSNGYATVISCLSGQNPCGPKSGNGNNNNFAFAVGAGLDIPVAKHVELRPVELDYVYTLVNANHFVYSTSWNNFRYVGGVNFTLGGKPPVPPTASCSVSPTEIWSGDPVTATISTQNFNPKHTITYAWTASGGKISGTGTTGNVDTTGLAPGSYMVKGTATDEKEKKNNIASCEASFTVKQPHPPVADCSASPNTVKANEASTLTVNASSPDNFPLTYAWSASAGHVNGTGANVSLDTTGAPEGAPITATATVTDSRGLSTTCSATVNVLSPPVTVAEVSEIGECKFMDAKRPARVDNTCKAILDDVALRIQHEPNGKFVIVGFTDEQETVTASQLGAQRSVNMKYYLVNGEGQQQIDATRIDVRTSGTMKERGAKIYFVPSGTTFTQESVAVDETQVKGQGRNAPAPKKETKKASAPKH